MIILVEMTLVVITGSLELNSKTPDTRNQCDE